MSYVKKTTIAIFLLIFINIFLFHTVLGIENITTEILQHDDIIASQNTTFSESTQNSSVENENIIIEAQRSFDKSLDILNIVVASIGVLVGALTLIFIILGAFGLVQYKIIEGYKKNIEKSVKSSEENAKFIENLKNKMEVSISTSKKEAEDISEKEMEYLLITKEPSKELMEISNEFVSTSKISEMFGTELKPNDYYLRGVNLFLKGKYEEAIKNFDKAPDYADALSYKGVALGELKRYEEAIEAYKKAIKLKPHRRGLWFNKGVALGKLGRYEEAIEAYDEAIKLKSDYADALYNRACHYSTDKGDPEKALSDLEKAIESDISLKETAKKDKRFEKLSDDKVFKELVE